MLWWNIVENTILSDLSFSLSLVSIFMNKWKTIHLFVQCLNASSFQYRLITNYTYIVLAAKYNWMNTILKHHKLNTKAKWFQFFNCATLLLLFLASYSEALNNINSIKSPSQCCSTSEPIISGSFFQLFKWVNQAERISMVALLQTEITFYCFQFVVYQWFFFRRCCRYCCCCCFLLLQDHLKLCTFHTSSSNQCACFSTKEHTENFTFFHLFNCLYYRFYVFCDCITQLINWKWAI